MSSEQTDYPCYCCPAFGKAITKQGDFNRHIKTAVHAKRAKEHALHQSRISGVVKVVEVTEVTKPTLNPGELHKYIDDRFKLLWDSKHAIVKEEVIEEVSSTKAVEDSESDSDDDEELDKLRDELAEMTAKYKKCRKELKEMTVDNDEELDKCRKELKEMTAKHKKCQKELKEMTVDYDFMTTTILADDRTCDETSTELKACKQKLHDNRMEIEKKYPNMDWYKMDELLDAARADKKKISNLMNDVADLQEKLN